MPVPGQWTIACIVTSAGQLFGLQSKSHDPKLKEIHESGSGDPFPTFAGIEEGMPQVSFSTTAIASAINVLGLTPFAVAGNDVDIYFQKYAKAGMREAGGAVKFRFQNGMFVPKSMSASQRGGGATLSYDFHGISADGEAAPYVVTFNESLPAITPATEKFTMGPVSINSKQLSGNQKLDVDFGYKVSVTSADGQPWPTHVGVEQFMPKIKISGLDLSAIDQFTSTGLPLTDWAVYFRAMQLGAMRVDVATSAHIKLFGNAGLLCHEKVGGSHGKESDASWCIYPTRDLSNPAFQISSASAISV